MEFEAMVAAARHQMTDTAYEFFAGGADDELTLADNVAAWSRIRLRPRVLRDVRTIDTTTSVLGTAVQAPILVAPVAYQCLAHPDGELAAARGTAKAGSVYIASTLATTRLEDIAEVDGPKWMQVYVQQDRTSTEALVARAVDAGYRALVLTVDLPVLGHRRRDERNAFTLPPHLSIANFGLDMPSPDGSSGLAAHVGRDLDAGLTFADIGWLRELSGLPILVKGVLRGDDARRCVEAGAAGVMVSNHGGRQLDTSIATADALPDIAEAVGADAEIYVDGGIRSGTDVLKAVAAGARAVLLGRPAIWGLGANGTAGVQAVVDGLRDELGRAMALCGTRSIAELTPDLLVRRIGG